MQFSEELISRARNAKSVVVLTGAGISAESGVPTFRGEEGLWKKYRPEELASFDAFIRNPELVWEWYGFRKQLISEVKPNPGHMALAEMESHYPEFWLVTQNVDSLHWRAGNEKILELHGNIMRSRCVQCGEMVEEVSLSLGQVPRCHCGGLIRPDVVWFGENLPQDILYKAYDVSKCCDLFLSVGTSALVQPAASLPLIAKQTGSYIVEINIEPTVISDQIDETLIGPSGDILPELVKEIKK